MTITFKATETFLDVVRTDLRRPHAHAAERVGFISVKAAQGMEGLVLLAQAYHPVADEDYLPDKTVGARIGPDAIRKSLEIALKAPVGVFHVHVHEHNGLPRFSRTDLIGQRATVPDFFKVRRKMPHGAIVLSTDGAEGSCWFDKATGTHIDQFMTVGPFTRFLRPFYQRLSQ